MTSGNHEYRMQRGRILKMLYRMYEQSMSIENISLALHHIGIPAPVGVVKGHITYLEDRGFLMEEEIKSRIGDVIKWRLTPVGVDLVEKNVSDDGIELGV